MVDVQGAGRERAETGMRGAAPRSTAPVVLPHVPVVRGKAPMVCGKAPVVSGKAPVVLPHVPVVRGTVLPQARMQNCAIRDIEPKMHSPHELPREI